MQNEAKSKKGNQRKGSDIDLQRQEGKERAVVTGICPWVVICKNPQKLKYWQNQAPNTHTTLEGEKKHITVSSGTIYLH